MNRITLEERSRRIQAELDMGTRVPTRDEMINSGRRRTQSKRELLATLQRIQRNDGRTVAFGTKF